MSDVVAGLVSRVVGEVMISKSDVAKKGGSIHDRVDDAFLETGTTLKHMGRLVSKVGGAIKAAEYFFKKIFRGARKVFRQVGKAGLEIGKRFLGQKAGEMIRQKIRERTGRYALGDDESYSGLVLALSEDIDKLGKDLIAGGVQLNGGVVVQETEWDPDTKKFLKDCVAIF
ncbi:hypothetical protein HPB47_009186 [Ixodes persulcatus]|uniref:Uncharacterized protein n=1 Tax=Ixodes persulcatus TaxID=34615 RepID=A0AC60P2L2_IXOPE|nr:hypothetical protein HPB47_009186 [Ixodes persulcatus]